MKAAVIGGGIAGLVAANTLARGGANVTLYEGAASLGGRASSDLFDGTWLNRGPHALYRTDGLRALRKLGVNPRGKSPNLAQHEFLIDGARLPAPTSMANAARASYLTWADRVTVAKFFASLFRFDPTDWDHRPLSELVTMYEQSPPTQLIIRWLAMLSTYGNSPRMSAGVALRQIRASMSNVIYVTDGWQSIVDALAEGARERGVVIETSSPVSNLVAIDTDVRVLAVPPKNVERLCGTSFGPRRATRMATLDLVLRGVPHEISPLFDIERGVYMPVFPGGIVHCAKYLDPFDEPAPEVTRADIERVLDAAIPSWREHVVTERYLARIAVNHWFPDADRGGTLGRPNVQLDERTFVAGDWVGPDGMLADAAILSGAQAAELALKRFSNSAAA